MFSQKSQIIHVVGPNGVFGLSHANTGQRTFLLRIVETDVIILSNQEKTCSGVEDLITVVQLNLLGDFILVVLDQNLLDESRIDTTLERAHTCTYHVILIENGEAISCHPHCIETR